MGRVSRYKRVSKDDVFAPKRPHKVDHTRDFAPSFDELNNAGGMTRSARSFLKAQNRMKKQTQAQQLEKLGNTFPKKIDAFKKKNFVSDAQRSASLEYADGTAKPAVLPELPEMQEGENFYEYSQRLREQITPNLRRKLTNTSERAEKRKDYYKQKKAKLQQKRRRDSDEDEDGKISDFTKMRQDSVAFGEQAQRPPIFSTLPRRSDKIDLVIAQRVSSHGSSNPLDAYREKKKHAVAFKASEPGTQPSPDQIQSKTQKDVMEDLRQQVQQRYREMKAARIAAPMAASPSSSSKEHRRKKSFQMKFSEEDLERFQEMRPESKKSIQRAKKEAREWLR